MNARFRETLPRGRLIQEVRTDYSIALQGFGKFLLISIFVFCFSAYAQETNRILFLHVKLKDGVLTLVDSKVRAGVLKSQRGVDHKRSLQFAVESKAGEPLWQSSMDDPTIIRVEEADPKTGELTPKIITRDEAEFTVRVPVTKQMNHVSFYHEEKIAAAEGGKIAMKSQRKLIGKLPTPEPE